jgi:hypothetical protein
MEFSEELDADKLGADMARSLGYFTIPDICAIYGITPTTEVQWRKRGKGPRWIVAGHRILRTKEAVLEDLRAREKERRTDHAGELL